MVTESVKALIGFFVLPVIGLVLLLLGWTGEGQRIYTLLGFAVLVLAVVYAASLLRVRTKAWSDWFPF